MSKLWEPPASPTASSPTLPIHARHASIASVTAPTTKMKYGGKRIAQIVKLKPEYVAVYKECHAKVWPEVLKQIRQCNIEDCESHQIPLSWALIYNNSGMLTLSAIRFDLPR